MHQTIHHDFQYNTVTLNIFFSIIIRNKANKNDKKSD